MHMHYFIAVHIYLGKNPSYYNSILCLAGFKSPFQVGLHYPTEAPECNHGKLSSTYALTLVMKSLEIPNQS